VAVCLGMTALYRALWRKYAFLRQCVDVIANVKALLVVDDGVKETQEQGSQLRLLDVHRPLWCKLPCSEHYQADVVLEGHDARYVEDERLTKQARVCLA